MKAFARFLLRLCFGFRAYGTGSLNTPGPVLLVPNHVSWIDWLFVGVLLDDDWRFVTSGVTANSSWIHGLMMRNRHTFPVDPTSPYAVREMADFLNAGGRLVLFAEGRISTTGSLMKLFDGTGFLIRQSQARVITCYLRGANRLRWTRHSGWKKWWPRVSAHCSEALTAPAFAHLSHSLAREKTTGWLRDQMIAQQFAVDLAHGPQTVLAAVAETAASSPGRAALEDITFTELTYRRVLVGTEVLASVWRRMLDGAEDKRVGLILPNVNALPLTLLSLWATGRVPVLLNFSSGIPTMLTCARLAGLRTILTSRTFLAKAKLDLAPLAADGLRILYLEDIRPTISAVTKLGALVRQSFAPGGNFDDAVTGLRSSDTAVVLFTSGSEGVPKGVELTHGNLLANIRQASAVIDLTDHDRFFNSLPLFHSFGLAAGTLFPLVRGCYVFLYPSPLHYRIVPTMVYDRRCTLLMGTNTFLNGYARKAHPYDFTTLRYLVAGAEKVQAATFETWTRKFGIRILEGYGATECSPIIAVNTLMAPSVGTAGRFLPGIEWKLEPVEGVAEGGRLLVRGPNIMKGYLNADAHARFAALGGWYDTGDIVHVDEDGFVHIRGRLKRFAKISGEMVSLTAVEDALAGAFPQFGPRCTVAVIARPDEDKGEALIAVTNDARVQLADVRAAIRAKGLGNLATPRALRFVQSMPKLGTGKADYRALQQLLADEDARSPAAAK